MRVHVEREREREDEEEERRQEEKRKQNGETRDGSHARNFVHLSHVFTIHAYVKKWFVCCV